MLFLFKIRNLMMMKMQRIYLALVMIITFSAKIEAQLLPLEQLESDDIETYTSVDRAYIEMETALKLKIFQLHSTLPPAIAQLLNLQALYMENLYFEDPTERFGNLINFIIY